MRRDHRVAFVTPAGRADRITAQGLSPFGDMFAELARLGFVEGETLTAERYSAEGHAELMRVIVEQVVRSNPDVVFAQSLRLARLFKQATATIPIVAYTSDPIAGGLVDNLARPGGNITGVESNGGQEQERMTFELLREMAPGVARVAYLATHDIWVNSLSRRVAAAARRSNVVLAGAAEGDLADEADFRSFFASLPDRRVEGVLVAQMAETGRRGELIVSLMREAGLPAIYPGRQFMPFGGLAMLGTDSAEIGRQLGVCIGRILDGAQPGEVPFFQPTTFELVVNMKTAKALGLTIPSSILARADEVIE